MIKKLTVNGITKTISNAELHVDRNEKEGVLIFNGEVFGDSIEKISSIKIGNKFYALSGASEGNVSSSGVELFNIAELIDTSIPADTIYYETGGDDYYREFVSDGQGQGQMILDAFNAGKKIVYIGNTSSWTGSSCTCCQEAFYVGDLDISNSSYAPSNFKYVVVLFHGIEWNNGIGDAILRKPCIYMFKFPK